MSRYQYFNYLKRLMEKNGCWAFLLGVFFSIVFLWPTITHFSTHLPSDQDGLFSIWTVNWISRAITTQQNFFNAPIFYPFTNTLAYSEPMFSQGLLNIPFTWLTNNLVVMSNIHLITGSIFCFWFMYLLVFDQTKSRLAAILASLVFSFGGWHAQYLVHLHAYLVAGIPLALWSWQRYQQFHLYRYLLLTALASLYQILNDPMYGFFLVVIFSVSALNRTTLQLIKVNLREISLTVLGVGIIAVTFYWPYFQVSRQFQYVRTIRDAAHFALSINQLVNPQLLGLCGFGLGLTFLSRHKLKSTLIKKQITPGLLIFLIGLVLALGPAAKWQSQTIKIFQLPIPLPYSILYYLVPGMKAFRAVSRWLVVANFGFAITLGWLATRAQLSRLKSLAVLIIIGGWLWWFNRHYQLFEINQQIPGIYQVVKNSPESTLAELPAYIWSQQPEVTAESYRLMYQNYHHKQLYNGASGFTPPSRLEEWPTVTALFPETSIIDRLKLQGIELVLVHFDEYETLFNKKVVLNSWPAPNPQLLKNQLENSDLLTLISCQETDCLYKLK